MQHEGLVRSGRRGTPCGARKLSANTSTRIANRSAESNHARPKSTEAPTSNNDLAHFMALLYWCMLCSCTLRLCDFLLGILTGMRTKSSHHIFNSNKAAPKLVS